MRSAFWTATRQGLARSVFTIHVDGKVSDTRSKPRETEKTTMNLGLVDLGQIDLLVREGFYSNRSDFIRTAIRGQLDRHGDAVRQLVSRRKPELGLRTYSRQELESRS